jgi:hypothetical protein
MVSGKSRRGEVASAFLSFSIIPFRRPNRNSKAAPAGFDRGGSLLPDQRGGLSGRIDSGIVGVGNLSHSLQFFKRNFSR